MEDQQHTEVQFHATAFLEKLTVHQLVEKFAAFIRLKDSPFQHSDYPELGLKAQFVLRSKHTPFYKKRKVNAA
jgi:hypothetical protein